MQIRKVFAAFVGAAALTATGMASANAAGVTAGTCSGGNIASGTYSSLTITGHCTIPNGAVVTVLGNVTIAPGAGLDASTHSTVTIGGNVSAGPGSYFALGCTPAHPCDGDMSEVTSTHDVVYGNVVLNNVFDAALNGDTIYGSLVVNGGGPGYSLNPWIPFSIKDDVVHGNVTVIGLRTSWFGIIRTTVGGNVLLVNILGADPDSNEVTANTIGGNLACYGMSPAAQYGDSVQGAPPFYGANQVGGNAVGQCAKLTVPPVQVS